MIPTSPILVPELHVSPSDPVWRMHAELARLSAADVRRLLDASPIVYPRSDALVGYVDLLPKACHDPHDVVVIEIPFANGWSRGGCIYTHALTSLMPQQRFIVFPNNGADNRTVCRLSGAERAQVASGDLGPIARRQRAVLKDLGVRRIRVAGYSQGAATGAALLREAAAAFKLGPSGLFEMPNVVERSSLQLAKDFAAPTEFEKTVNASAVPLLSEVQHTRGGLDKARQLRGFMRLNKAAVTNPVNRAIWQGLTHARFASDIETALQESTGLKLLLGGGTVSRVMPHVARSHIMKQIEHAYPHRVRWQDIAGHGHGVGLNVLTYALLMRAALTDTLV